MRFRFLKYISAESILRPRTTPSLARATPPNSDSKVLVQWSDIAHDSVTQPKIGIIYCFFESTLTFDANTGVQRVARRTARALIESGCNVIAATWDHNLGMLAPLLPKELLHLAKWNGPRVDQWHQWIDPKLSPDNSWLMSNEMPPNLGPGINHELVNFAKANGIKTSVTFFDAIPCLLPNLYPAGSYQLHRSYMAQLAEWDLIFPISKQSANDMLVVLSELDINLQLLISKLKPLPLPTELHGSPRKTNYPLSLNNRPFILVLSTFEQRKNHLTLFKAMEIAQIRLTSGFDLVLVGHPLERSIVKLANKYQRKFPTMLVKHDASDQHVQDLLDRADFTIYPSIEEGFGLPIVESLWNGKPVICDKFRAINDLGSEGGCLQVDVLNAEELADAIVTLATNLQIFRLKCAEIDARTSTTWDDYVSSIVFAMSNAN
jgi:glycosyltransferase involved in cell wall biosynthesis